MPVVDLNMYHPRRELLDRNITYSTKVMDPAVSIEPKVLALDPGETTGWCLITPTMNRFAEIESGYETMDFGQIDCGARQGNLVDDDEISDTMRGIGNGRNPNGESMGVGRILRLIDENPTVAVLAEDFIVDFNQITKARNAVSPIRITAKLEQELWQRGMNLHLQERSNPKVSMNNDRLRDLGVLGDTSGLPHARDAMRHGLYFLRRCQNSADLRHIAWPWLFPAPEVKPKRKRDKKQGARIVFGD